MFEFILLYIMLSSAKRRILDRLNVFVCVVDVQQEEYRTICPRPEPCGTPYVTSVMSDRAPLSETRCLRCDRKGVIQLCVLPVIPYQVSLYRKRLCGILSKALAKSSRIAPICVLLSNAVIQS